MKKLLFLMVALVCSSYSQAYADYSFTFMSGDGTYGVQGTLITPSNGDGPLTVSGGSVIGDGTSNNGISYSLVSLSDPRVNLGGPSIRPFGATDLIFDNQLTPGSNPVLDGNGLVFESANTLSYLNIWGNSPGSYTLFQLGYNTATQAELYGPQVNGIATVTATPIPAAAWLFGSGLIGLVGIRKKLS
ncbi:MAG: hypothetical protein ABSA46_18585 [Thermodesulfovibrionales bacterium]